MSRTLLSLINKKACHKRNFSHVPVMVGNVTRYLQDKNVIIDMTFGGGGHTKAILETSPKASIICLDRDANAVKEATILANDFPGRVYPVHGKFSDLPGILAKLNVNAVDGILFDFGCSSEQMDVAERGFALSKTGPLDMRMDTNDSATITAGQLLNYAEEQDLFRIFRVYGQEKHARKIARAIVESRYSFNPLKTTTDLAKLIETLFGSRTDKMGRPAHPATKVFQALRIFVNNELNEIDYAMGLARRYMKLGGTLVTISFHSLEDTIVKRHLTNNLLGDYANPVPLRYSSHFAPGPEEQVKPEPVWIQLTKHVVTPNKAEVVANPRSRSAKLRAAVKVK